MSSILEKPFIFPSLAVEGAIPVNALKMKTFIKSDEDNRLGNARPGETEYFFVWQSTEYAVGAFAAEIKWKYKDKKCRDNEYANLREQFGQGVTGDIS